MFEIGTEEMPPAEARSAATQMHRLMIDALAGTRLTHGPARVVATPRRLVVTVDDVPAREQDHARSVRGPKVSAAFTSDGSLTPAAQGFARSQGVEASELDRIDVAGVEYVAVTRDEVGRDVVTALADVLPAVVTGLRSAKNMRWLEPQLSFTRPIRWLTALWGDIVVPITVGTLVSDRVTRTLRNDAQPEVAVPSAETLLEVLGQAGIIADADERRIAIVDSAIALSAAVSGHVNVDEDAALLDQIAYLIESPTPLLGSFATDYLKLPDAILTTVMRKHQRYLPVRDAEGSLMPHFVCIANGDIDPDVVRAGNESVLRARYEDAAFFYRADSTVAPSAMRERLATLTFADRLGTMYDRADRIGAIALRLAEAVRLDEADRKIIERAAPLTKFDLGSQMVTELTSLAGVMAKEYATAAGEPEAVAQALYDLERPRSAGDAMPATNAGAVLSLADRLDYLAGLAATVGLPTGSSDQYALRRAALGAQAVHRAVPALWSLSLADGIGLAAELQPVEVSDDVQMRLREFMNGRLEQTLTEEGVPVDRIRAVFVHADRPATVDATLAQLDALIGDPDFRGLTETIQRASRIVPSGTEPRYDAAKLREPAEVRLDEVLTQTRAAVHNTVDLVAFTEATRPLTASVTAFFDDVFVMDDDLELRAARLGLLASVAALGAPLLNWDQVR